MPNETYGSRWFGTTKGRTLNARAVMVTSCIWQERSTLEAVMGSEEDRNPGDLGVRKIVLASSLPEEGLSLEPTCGSQWSCSGRSVLTAAGWQCGMIVSGT